MKNLIDLLKGLVVRSSFVIGVVLAFLGSVMVVTIQPFMILSTLGQDPSMWKISIVGLVCIIVAAGCGVVYCVFSERVWNWLKYREECPVKRSTFRLIGNLIGGLAGAALAVVLFAKIVMKFGYGL